MKPRLLIIYMLLVLVPLATIAWLGGTLSRNEQAMMTIRFRELLTNKLNDVDTDIARLLEQRERELMEQPALSSLLPEALRERANTSSVVRHYFVLDGRGDLVYPSPAGTLTSAETAFLDRTMSIWVNGEIPGPETETRNRNAVSRQPQQVSQTTQQQVQAPKQPASTTKGWHAWYRGSGIGLIFWWRDTSGTIVGAELNEMRLMADIIAMLPEAWPDLSSTDSPLPNGRIALTDSKEAVIYQWGGYLPKEGEAPQAQLALHPPLSSWCLKYYAPGDAVGMAYSGGVWFNVLSGIVVLAIALVGLSVYFYRENTRAMRDALQRVLFVNQVSHELKTPLTNIRMYAEILEEELGETDDAVSRRLGVIVSESQRLSRLINNVLTFGQDQRGMLKLHKTVGNVDDVLRDVVGRFDAALQARGIRVVFDAGADGDAEFDRDALEQIMGNLLSNAEKYAAEGSSLDICSRRDDGLITIRVADNGPGIPPHLHERVFDAFYRISDKLTDGVAGAGIGLTIARQLARLHGGDLTLEASTNGASFKVILLAKAHFTNPENTI